MSTIADRHSCEGAPRAVWLRAPLQPLAIGPIFPADCALPTAIVLTLNNTFLWDRTLEAQQMRVAAASPETKEALNHIEEQFITDVPTLLTLDRPKHTVYRSLVDKLFTASRIKSAGPSVQKVIDEVIAAADGDRSIKFISRIAFPIPVTIIFDLLGVPEEHREAFELGAAIFADALRIKFFEDEELVRRAQIQLDLQQLILRTFEERRNEPRDDMISILATSRLDEEDRPLMYSEA